VNSTALLPETVDAATVSQGRLGFAFGGRSFILLLAGLAWLGPSFLDPRFLYGMLAWDALLLAACVVDWLRLPKPKQLVLERKWSAPAALSVPGKVELLLSNSGQAKVFAQIADEAPGALRNEIPQVELVAPPGGTASTSYTVVPAVRGNTGMGDAYVRYQTPLHLAERWTRAALAQAVRVYPNLAEAKRHTIYLVRSRQIEMEKRRTRIKGMGREFESLRDFRQGDEFRNICWSATARRGKLVSKTFQVERSQTVWLVVDCGRLMRTRVAGLSKLDYAVNACLCLAEVALYSGDRVGLLAYGRGLQQRILPGRGNVHLRQLLEQLVDVREEATEADHLRAVSVLLSTQKRRSLVVWLTDLAETAMTPEVVDAAMRLSPQHLVLLAVLGQPDLSAAAEAEPIDAGAMYQAAAAQEVMHRREVLLAKVRERGALTIEVTSAALSSAVVNSYLDIKQRNQL
jgi:uncharacterized protein (DUF58 family)